MITDRALTLAEVIGRGLVAARNRVCNLYLLNAATGRLYCDTVGRWLEKTGLAAIDKGVRSRLLTCIDSLAAIELWRETISVARRMELTRPSAKQLGAALRNLAEYTAPRDRLASIGAVAQE